MSLEEDWAVREILDLQKRVAALERATCPAAPEPAPAPEPAAPAPEPAVTLYDPGVHTASEVNTYLGGVDTAERERVIAAERAGKNRATIIGS